MIKRYEAGYRMLGSGVCHWYRDCETLTDVTAFWEWAERGSLLSKLPKERAVRISRLWLQHLQTLRSKDRLDFEIAGIRQWAEGRYHAAD